MRPGCELNGGMWPKGTVGGCVMLSCGFRNLPFWKREAPTLCGRRGLEAGMVAAEGEEGWRPGFGS